MLRTLRRIAPVLAGLAFMWAPEVAGADEDTTPWLLIPDGVLELHLGAPTIAAVPSDSSTVGATIFGLSIFPLTGSLAEHKLPGHYSYTLPWGRGPRLSAERTLGLGWDIRF